jgi:hypothetical protein
MVGLLSLGHQKASDTRRALTQKGSDTRRALIKGMAAPQANKSDNINQRYLIKHSTDKG